MAAGRNGVVVEGGGKSSDIETVSIATSGQTSWPPALPCSPPPVDHSFGCCDVITGLTLRLVGRVKP